MLNALKKALKLRGSSITEEPKTNLQDNTPSGEKLILNKIQPIEGTPFHTAKKGDNQYVIVMGNHLISNEIFYSRGSAIKSLDKINYWTILNIVGIYIEQVENFKKLNK